MNKVKMAFLLIGSACILAGCSSDPVVQPITNPADKKPVDVPMPVNGRELQGAGSLWRPGSHAFFRDSRASKVGDIITVDISIADTATLSNGTSRSRTNSESNNMTNMFGLENILPTNMSTTLVDTSSDTSNEGTGSIARSETISLTLAALVTQVLPNGNLVIGGHQQIKVNGEMRDLKIAGIVRTEDITSDNTIDLTQIAEARISYGGEGVLTKVQTPRWGVDLFDSILPW